MASYANDSLSANVGRGVKTSHFSNEDLHATKLFDVTDLKAVVTGGGTGIGLMITQALVSNGATVYITGRREEVLESVVEQYSTGPGKIIALDGDISSKEECVRLAREVSKAEPAGIHALVNNAGIARDDNTKFSANGTPDSTNADAISTHLLRSDPDAWASTFHTNVTSHFFMSAAFIPLLALGTKSTPHYSSSITNITSISGLMKGSSSGQFAYASSKAALVHLTRMLATTLKDTKIRVNQIAPGIFPSEMTTSESDEAQKSELSSKISNPAWRGGSDADMAASILMLVGPGGVFYNNQLLHPDGGQILAVPAAM